MSVLLSVKYVPAPQVKAIAEEIDVGFLGLGFDPKWSVEQTPMMPKVRTPLVNSDNKVITEPLVNSDNTLITEPLVNSGNKLITEHDSQEFYRSLYQST